MSEESAKANTDRELWRESPDCFYADSIHVTEQGRIGISVGGHVIVRTLTQWHAMAVEIERLRAENAALLDERERIGVQVHLLQNETRRLVAESESIVVGLERYQTLQRSDFEKDMM